MRLEGKTALVTGAARGIGEAIARAFVENGAFVFVTDIDDERGAAVAADLGDAGRYLPLDVRDESHWERSLEQALRERGPLDVLVNNAGITGFERGSGAHDPEHATLDDWHAVHRTNLDGVFLGCKHAIQVMRAHGSGSIVNISSRSGLVGIAGAAAYASSKAAGPSARHASRPFSATAPCGVSVGPERSPRSSCCWPPTRPPT